jgi:hypothetical protein
MGVRDLREVCRTYALAGLLVGVRRSATAGFWLNRGLIADRKTSCVTPVCTRSTTRSGSSGWRWTPARTPPATSAPWRGRCAAPSATFTCSRTGSEPAGHGPHSSALPTVSGLRAGPLPSRQAPPTRPLGRASRRREPDPQVLTIPLLGRRRRPTERRFCLLSSANRCCPSAPSDRGRPAAGLSAARLGRRRFRQSASTGRRSDGIRPRSDTPR